MRQFEGLSDFFRNATDEEKQEVYLKVIEKSNQEQLKIIEQAKEIKEDVDLQMVQHELAM